MESTEHWPRRERSRSPGHASWGVRYAFSIAPRGRFSVPGASPGPAARQMTTARRSRPRHRGAAWTHEHHRFRPHQERAPAGLGRGGGRADRARRDPLVRRLGRGVRQPLPDARRRGHVRAAVRREAAELLPRAVRSRRRRARRGPHVHLLGDRGRGRADEQLARPGRDARDADRAVRAARCAGARCTSCRSRWARSARTRATSACS